MYHVIKFIVLALLLVYVYTVFVMYKFGFMFTGNSMVALYLLGVGVVYDRSFKNSNNIQ